MSANTKHVLFDLDGTLIDTAPDLADALNQTRINHGKQTLPFEQIRPVVSLGGEEMIKLGFNITVADPGFEELRSEFLEIYSNNIAKHSRLFPGMDEVLSELENKGSLWGIVTNKPGWLTTPLIEEMDLDDRTDCIVSGDTLEQRKPHPAPILYACELLKCSPRDAIYTGDAMRDIAAGISAGMKTLVATYGYINESDTPENWGADGIIDRPLQILDWLNTHG